MENFTKTLVLITTHLENVNVEHFPDGGWTITASTPGTGLTAHQILDLAKEHYAATFSLIRETWVYTGEN